MKKAWSFFWLVVASVVAATILASWIAPYMWVIITLVCIAALAFAGYKTYSALSSRRRHF